MKQNWKAIGNMTICLKWTWIDYPISIPNKKLGSSCLSLSIRPVRLPSDYKKLGSNFGIISRQDPRQKKVGKPTQGFLPSRQGKGSSTVYIRTVSTSLLLSALLNWFKLVYRLLGQSNMHRPYTQFLPRQARKESNVPKLKIS